MRLFCYILTAILLLGLAAPAFVSTQQIWAQDFEDDDAFDEDEEESKEVETDEPEKEQPEKEEQVSEDEDAFEDEEEDKKEIEAEKKEDELERKKEEERLKKEEAEREKKRRAEENRRKAEAAAAEERLRKAKKKAEEQKRKKYGARIQERKERQAYAKYYNQVMQQKGISSRLPGRTGFAFGFGLGLQPNAGNSVNEGFTFSEQIPFYLQGQSNIITSLQLSAPGLPENKGVAHIANMFQKNVSDINSAISGDTPEAKVEASSGSITTFPIVLNAAYYGSFYMVRVGVHFHHSILGLGGKNKFNFQFIDQEVFIQHKSNLMRLEVPISVAFRFLSSRSYGAYLGGGANFFYGSNSSSIESETVTFSNGLSGKFEGQNDSFTATTFGFHFLLGIEAEIFSKTYAVVELFQNFGVSSRVKDSSIGERETSSSGVAESQRPDEIQLNFTGTQVIAGVRRFL